jgi:transcriptional regulator with XRE-family HTH domain
MGSLWEIAMKHPVDAHVGRKIRHQRWMMGMTQQQLAEKVGIKFQQVQKYETGMNRVSASRLWEIAETLGVTIGFFFDGMDGERPVPSNVMADKEAAELVRSYYAIPETQRRRLFDLAKVLSEAA